MCGVDSNGLQGLGIEPAIAMAQAATLEHTNAIADHRKLDLAIERRGRDFAPFGRAKQSGEKGGKPLHRMMVRESAKGRLELAQMPRRPANLRGSTGLYLGEISKFRKDAKRVKFRSTNHRTGELTCSPPLPTPRCTSVPPRVSMSFARVRSA